MNRFRILEDGTVKVFLESKKHGRKYAFCDIEDWNELKKFSWSLKLDGRTFYAKTHFPRNSSTLMHRMILKCANLNESVVNHKDHNGLNNRRNNLEICSRLDNSRFRQKPITNSTGFKGVQKRGKKFVAKIKKFGKSIWIGTYKNIRNAALAYNREAKRQFGKFAKLNVL